MKSSTRRKVLCYVGIILCLNAVQCFGSKVIRTSARSIALRAGAAQFKESIEESDRATRRDRRLADDDSLDDDYQVYQGVVGRPGIDFPVLVGIPFTNFNCRKMGNGYFADLETDCQVFHICDTGRKISFLCPNGTIFKQNELICDWWFKVNCAQAPGQYADSAELLARHRGRPSRVSVTTENRHSSRTPHSRRNRPTPKQNIEYNSNQVSDESVDFEDLSAPVPVPRARRPPPSIIRTSQKTRYYNNEDDDITTDISGDYSTETQEVAESGSFLQPNGGHSANQPTDFEDRRKYRDDYINVEYPEISTRPRPSSTKRLQKPTTIKPTTYSRGRGGAKFGNPPIRSRSGGDRPASTSVNYKGEELSLTTSTPSFNNENAYSTAKRLGTTKSNASPFYTPTVPTITNKVSESHAYQASASTPTESTPSKHAIEMMKMLQELDPLQEILPPFIEKSIEGNRTGLAIPPSSGPDTLHSLALYFATAVETLGKPNATSSQEIFEETSIASSHVSNRTTNKYDQLFGNANDITTESEMKIINDLSSRIDVENVSFNPEFGRNPFLPPTQTPQVRELAQVFTHALSAYLHDPQQFRKILAEIRPKEPSSTGDDEISNDIFFSRFGSTGGYSATTPVSTNGATYLPTTTMSTLTTVTDDFEVLDFSDVTQSTAHFRKETTNAVDSTTLSPTTAFGGSSGESTTGTTTVSSYGSDEVTSTSSSNDVSGENTTDDAITTDETPITTYEPPVPNNQPFIKDAEKTPGSDLIARNLEEDSTSTPREARTFAYKATKQLISSTPNNLAMEINGNLVLSTTFPYVSEIFDSIDTGDERFDGSNYFPDSSDEKAKKNLTNYKPYGNGLKLPKSTPLSETEYQNTQTVPSSRWGSDEADTTTEKEIGSTSSYPGLFDDLLPPLVEQNTEKKLSSLNLEVLPPLDKNDNDDEHLESAESQSGISGKSGGSSAERGRESKKVSETSLKNRFDDRDVTTAKSSTDRPLSRTDVKGHYITQTYPTVETTTFNVQTTTDLPETTNAETEKYSSNSWSQLPYTAFIDPLTINDGLMELTTDDYKRNVATEAAPLATDYPGSNDDISHNTTELPENLETVAPTDSFPTPSSNPTIPPPLNRRGKSFPTTLSSRNSLENIKEEPMEIMQERANEIFGNLNETQADKLMKVMKKADTNKTVKRLILLLIQTCDDDYDKTAEETRKALLNALIGMDGDDEIKIINTRHNKQKTTLSTTQTPTTEAPITSTGGYRIQLNERFSSGENFEGSTTVTTQGTTNFNSAESTTATTQSDTLTGEYTKYSEFRIDLSDEDDLASTTTVAPSTNYGSNEENETSTTVNLSTYETQSTTISPQSTVTDSYKSSSEIRDDVEIISTISPNVITTTTLQPLRRKGKSLDGFIGQTNNLLSESSSTPSHSSSVHADERALELLKSLYSLASKWGRKR